MASRAASLAAPIAAPIAAPLLVSLALACSEGTAHDEGSDEFEAESGSESDDEVGPTDSESSSGSESSTGSEDSSDTGPIQELVEVGHEREFRGVWVATVYNINWPSQSGLAQAQAQAELTEMLDTIAAINLNAIVFQVRPESDALYPSELDPWSRFMAGSQGEDPGWDPLDFLCTEAHARNIEVHAWLNPYRAAASAGSTLVPPHVALQEPEHAHPYNGALWMDPGAVAVREHVVDVTLDIVDRYPIDGIHLDDYFYPYPDGSDFPDSLTWNQYLGEGGDLSRDDWRRDNVNALVEELHDSINALNPDVRFGIAPFGIYRPGTPPGIVGLDQYAEIYADPKLWIEQGWVDYLSPQLYWPTTYAQQDYEVLLEWWTTLNPDRYIFAGNYLSKLGSAPEWSLDEMLLQVELSRFYADGNSLGNVFFQIQPLMADTLGINGALFDEFYLAPALTPALAERLDEVVEPPVATVEGSTVSLADPAGQRLRAWVVYADDGQGGWVLDRIVPLPELEIALAPGRWAISAAGWHNVESLGVVVEI